MNYCSEQIVGSFGGGSVTSLPPLPTRTRAAAANERFESHPAWGGNTRQFESGDTHRLNQAHWQNATDSEINLWLRDKLALLRARSTYEARNNGMLAGVADTIVEDTVGPDGPMLEVQSDDPEYNAALEEVWREFWRAPTFKPNVSGTQLLKLWIRNLPRAGEFLAVIGTDRNAEGPVQMRIRPVHPRRLQSPSGDAGNPRMMMGIEHDRNDRPTRYWISETDGLTTTHVPYSPDDIIHEFILDEDGQSRGFPWFVPALGPAADLRDYDDDVQHASRRAARSNGMMYTEHPDAPVWTAPETYTEEPGQIAMAPPGWKPLEFTATQPAAQYPDYRAERQRESGRPFNMPLLMVRLDASKHNYSSARLDTQGWARKVEGIQDWISGTPESVGTLSRLVWMVAAEARFSIPALRKKPKGAILNWTWPKRPHVDPKKEADAEIAALEAGTTSLVDICQQRGTTIDRHAASLKRSIEAFEAAGIPKPAYMLDVPPPPTAAGPGAAAPAKPAATAKRELTDQITEIVEDLLEERAPVDA